MSQLWFIDSRDRRMGSNHDFYIEPRNRLKNVRRMTVREIEVPFSWYVFLSSHIINFREGAGNQLSATLTASNYTFTELISHLGTIMTNATGATLLYTWTYNSNTGKLTCSTTSAFPFLWSSGTNAGNGIDQLFGFTEAGGTASNSSSATSHIAGNVATASGDNALYLEVTPISMNDSKQMSILANNPQSVLCKIPITESPGSVISYQPEIYVIDTKSDIDRLHFRLIDRNNTSINLNGREMSITIEVEY